MVQVGFEREGGNDDSFERMMKAYVDAQVRLAIGSHRHQGLGSQRINLFDVFGSIQTVENEPSEQPQDISGQIVIYNAQLYWYDYLNKEWRFSLSGTSQNVSSETIATTGDTDTYYVVPATGVISNVYFSASSALAANDTNYITWSITNLGQAGAGSTVILDPTDANTTKSTGGSAIVADSKRTLTLSGTSANLNVTEGDRLRIRASVTGTLANTVTFPTYLFRII